MTDPDWVVIFNGVNGTGTGAADGASPFACNAAQNVDFEFEWATGDSAGVVVLEGASNASYAGTWDLLLTENFANGAVIQRKAVAVPGFCRIRATTPVSGGGSPGLIVRGKRRYAN